MSENKKSELVSSSINWADSLDDDDDDSFVPPRKFLTQSDKKIICLEEENKELKRTINKLKKELEMVNKNQSQSQLEPVQEQSAVQQTRPNPQRKRMKESNEFNSSSSSVEPPNSLRSSVEAPSQQKQQQYHLRTINNADQAHQLITRPNLMKQRIEKSINSYVDRNNFIPRGGFLRVRIGVIVSNEFDDENVGLLTTSLSQHLMQNTCFQNSPSFSSVKNISIQPTFVENQMMLNITIEIPENSPIVGESEYRLNNYVRRV